MLPTRHARPIAIIGMVNLKTGKNAMFGNVFNCWEEGTFTAMLLKHIGWDGDTTLRIVVTSGVNGDPIGDRFALIADQSRRQIGDRLWEVVAVEVGTKAGLANLGKIAGKSSLSMATYK